MISGLGITRGWLDPPVVLFLWAEFSLGGIIHQELSWFPESKGHQSSVSGTNREAEKEHVQRAGDPGTQDLTLLSHNGSPNHNYRLAPGKSGSFQLQDFRLLH